MTDFLKAVDEKNTQLHKQKAQKQGGL